MLVYEFDVDEKEIELHCKLPRENCESHNDSKKGLVKIFTRPFKFLYFKRLFANRKEMRNEQN